MFVQKRLQICKIPVQIRLKLREPVAAALIGGLMRRDRQWIDEADDLIPLAEGGAERLVPDDDV